MITHELDRPVQIISIFPSTILTTNTIIYLYVLSANHLTQVDKARFIHFILTNILLLLHINLLVFCYRRWSIFDEAGWCVCSAVGFVFVHVFMFIIWRVGV